MSPLPPERSTPCCKAQLFSKIPPLAKFFVLVLGLFCVFVRERSLSLPGAGRCGKSWPSVWAFLRPLVRAVHVMSSMQSRFVVFKVATGKTAAQTSSIPCKMHLLLCADDITCNLLSEVIQTVHLDPSEAQTAAKRKPLSCGDHVESASQTPTSGLDCYSLHVKSHDEPRLYTRARAG